MCCADTDADKSGDNTEGEPLAMYPACASSFEHDTAYCLYLGNGCNSSEHQW